MARRNRKRRRTSPVIVLVVIVLVAIVSVEAVKVFNKLQVERAKETNLTQEVQQMEQENAVLRSDLSKADDKNFIKSLARDLLGLAEDGERIFYDVND